MRKGAFRCQAPTWLLQSEGRLPNGLYLSLGGLLEVPGTSTVEKGQRSKLMWEEYLFPASVQEAVAMLAQWEGRACLIAGGTDLVLEFNEGKREADCLIDITRIPELKEITLQGDTITVGAAVTFRQLDDSPLIRQRATVLAEAAHTVGSLQIRNVATLGGNVVSALPAADGILGLSALDAEAELADSQGRRWVPLEELFDGPGQSRIDAVALDAV